MWEEGKWKQSLSTSPQPGNHRGPEASLRTGSISPFFFFKLSPEPRLLTWGVHSVFLTLDVKIIPYASPLASNQFPGPAVASTPLSPAASSICGVIPAKPKVALGCIHVGPNFSTPPASCLPLSPFVEALTTLSQTELVLPHQADSGRF